MHLFDGPVAVGDWKQVHLQGPNGDIQDLIALRVRDENCRQLPLKELPSPFHVRVCYTMVESEVQVRSVHVAVGHRWACLFDLKQGHQGSSKWSSVHTRHYLEPSQLKEILSPIRDFEERVALDRLVQAGPDAIPKSRSY